VAEGGLRLLLDANVLIWLQTAPARVAGAVTSAIEDPENAKFVSAATVWEIEIKRAAGRLDAPPDLVEATVRAGFLELPVRFEHASALRSLPRLHADPFDRLLIAQARVEGLTIVTADEQIARYDVPLLRVA
jgi:Uncharacterized protein conserved in bacteria